MSTISQNVKSIQNGTAASSTLGRSDEPSRKTWFDLTEAILLPLILTLFGLLFTWSQFVITNKRQDSDSADKATETKETVLTDYAKSISLLVTDHNLRGQVITDPQDVKNVKINPEDAKIAAQGLTLIALRRLNVPDKDGVDKGELKGFLIRYLFEAKLIGGPSFDVKLKPIIDLSGADLTKVVLKDAWLYKIDLEGAWINKGNFKKTDLTEANLSRTRLINADLTEANLSKAILRNADLTEANLSKATLRNADLRFADLSKAEELSKGKLEHACYVKGTSGRYFPPNFNPDEANMIAMAEDESHPTTDKGEINDKFKPCPSP